MSGRAGEIKSHIKNTDILKSYISITSVVLIRKGKSYWTVSVKHYTKSEL